MNQFILSTPQGERYATLTDLPLTRAGELMLIGALRDGFAVAYETSGTTAHPHRAAAPVATKPPRVVKPGRKAKRAKPDAAPATLDTYSVGDSVYLAWSGLSESMRLQLSQYRTTKGVVTETRQGRRPVAVRFNGDPEVYFERRELARVPEVSG